uniref:LOW QUALITY PROTEIN: probable G-protein coupled receptor 158 n=1 Tax=Geotrypetes seraphini TaxID=260995 RepID=A0A6P8Q1J2_GEOSA|nr:LOW QUALITY PROTEIN: probable G-protein coupled receptor 158 [Geotrypetes seraphini]
MAFHVFLMLFLVHLGFVAGSSHELEGRTLHNKEKKPPKHKQSIHNNIRTLDQSTLWIRSTESTILAQKLIEDVPKHVASFLYTGNPHELRGDNCSRRYQMASLTGRSHITSHSSLNSVIGTLNHATNFLNTILQSNKSREQNLQGDMEWYHALIRSILESDSNIFRAAVTFNTEPSSSAPQVFLQATREDSQVLFQELSPAAHRLRNATGETEGLNNFRQKWGPHMHGRVLNSDAKHLENNWKKGGSYVADKNRIKWSSPYLECENGNYKPRWLLALSAAFYGLKPNLIPEFRGVVKVDINLQKLDIDQCSNDGWFAGTHKCQNNSAECVPIKGLGFVLGAYKCICKAGFYHPNIFSVNSFPKNDGETHLSGGKLYEEAYECLPCREGCSYCTDDTPCYAQEDTYLRLAIISFQAFCMLLDFISMLLVYHFRKAKSIRASGLVLLETILFGSLLLYFPVIILYFEPSTFRCILLRWVRLLGYATVYGTVTLKLYRVLKVFLSRTAQRIPYMTSCRVMRMLAVILLIVIWFLIAWTSAVCQNMDKNISLITQGHTSDHLYFNMCLIDRWDYMMAIAEFLFLLWGVYLCYAVRTVPSAFHEPRYMAVAVHNELIISAVFHTIRFILASRLQPDWMLMLFFVHTHLTVTVTIGLLLIPKFSQSSNNPRDDIAAETYEDELDIGRSGSYLNSSINSTWSEHSLDPEDIRDELKKLYAQLEIYKRKKMLANNPHLQKKRCSKKGLGRSIMRRITEIPETVSRQCSKEEKDLMDQSGTKNSTSAIKKVEQDSTNHCQKTKEDSLKNFPVRKSHSTYDHVEEQNEEQKSVSTENIEVTESSVLDSLTEKTGTKTGTDTTEAESTESVPLVCKSVSAHNLCLDKKPLHSRASVLQKSLSVIASAKEKTLGLTAKMQNLEDSSKSQKTLPKNNEANKTSDKCESKDIQQKSSSQIEEPRRLHKSGIMKQQAVGYSITSTDPDICNSGLKEKLDLEEVCPWEVYDLTPNSVPSETKAQKHVSIAPLELEKHHSSRIKGRSHNKLKVTDGHSQSNQKSLNKAEPCSKETQELIPNAGKGNISKKHHTAIVYPGNTDEVLKTGKVQTLENGYLSTIGEQKSNLSPVEEHLLLTGSHHNSNNNLQKPSVFPDELRQWELDNPDFSNADKGVSLPTTSASAIPAVKPPSPSNKRAFGLMTGRKEAAAEKEKGKSKNKGKETESKDLISKIDKSKSAEVCSQGSQKSLGVSANKGKSTSNEQGMDRCKLVDICPWEIDSEATDSAHSKRMAEEGTNLLEICPWEFQGQTDGK